MTNDETLSVVPTVDDDRVHRLVRIALLVVAGLVVVGLLSLLPGLDRALSVLPVAGGAVLLAGATYLVVAGLVAAAPSIGRVVEDCLEGPDRVVSDAAAIATYAVVFVAVLIAYRGFQPAFEPLVAGVAAGWLYHAAFLAAGLLPVAAIARRFYWSLDPVSDLLTRAIVRSVRDERDANANPSRE